MTWRQQPAFREVGLPARLYFFFFVVSCFPFFCLERKKFLTRSASQPPVWLILPDSALPRSPYPLGRRVSPSHLHTLKNTSSKLHNTPFAEKKSCLYVLFSPALFSPSVSPRAPANTSHEPLFDRLWWLNWPPGTRATTRQPSSPAV